MNKKSRWYSVDPIKLIGVVVSILLVGFIALVVVPGSFTTACGCGGVSPRHISSSNAAQIAKTYAAYSQSSKEGRILEAKPGDTAHDAAVILSRYASLNDATFWFNWSDPALKGKPTRNQYWWTRREIARQAIWKMGRSTPILRGFN